MLEGNNIVIMYITLQACLINWYFLSQLQNETLSKASYSKVRTKDNALKGLLTTKTTVYYNNQG